MASIGALLDQGECLVLWLLQQTAAEFGRQRLADRHQIVAGIEPCRDFADLFAKRLAVAQHDRAGQHVDLRAGVVDQIFLGDVIAGEGQKVGQRVADDGAAAMPDMHRTGRIGRDIFDIGLLAGADRRAAVVRPCCKDVGKMLVPETIVRPRLTKPGPATSTLATSGSVRKAAAMVSASARGFWPAALASTIAALVARSPCVASRGGSTAMRDKSSAPPSLFFKSSALTVFMTRSLKSAKMFMVNLWKSRAACGRSAAKALRPNLIRAYGQTAAGAP